MINAVIDVGSNSIRLSVFETDMGRYNRIYSSKRIVGLAGYISKGELSDDGIKRACEAILEFKAMLDRASVTSVSVFATASLRNISNSEDATSAIELATGYPVEVISGWEEACFGYFGAKTDIDTNRGVLTDIGGGSTELVFFNNWEVESAQSLPIGSLNLYSKNVSELLPSKKEIKDIREQLDAALSKAELGDCERYENLYGIGGTARATVKLANRAFSLDSANSTNTAKQLSDIRKLLCGGSEVARNIIIKTCPERIHTIVPGVLVLDTIAKKTGSKKLTVSRFGVREGYLCQRILAKKA